MRRGQVGRACEERVQPQALLRQHCICEHRLVPAGHSVAARISLQCNSLFLPSLPPSIYILVFCHLNHFSLSLPINSVWFFHSSLSLCPSFDVQGSFDKWVGGQP